MEILHESGRFFIPDGSGGAAAELNYTVSAGVAAIMRTFVSEALRGQGVAGQLMSAAAAYFADQALLVQPVCSYAVDWFAHHSEYSALLSPDSGAAN